MSDLGTFLTLEQARKLLTSIKEACQDTTFQEKLQDIRKNARSEAGKNGATGSLFWVHCGNVVQEFGFKAAKGGFERMFGEIWAHGKDVEIRQLTMIVEKLLGQSLGNWFGISKAYFDGPVRSRIPDLNRAGVQDALCAIEKVVSESKFQAKMCEKDTSVLMVTRHGRSDISVKKTIRITTVLVPLLVEYGFSGNAAGTDQLCVAVQSHKYDPNVLVSVEKIERLLQVPVGSWFGIDYEVSAPIPEVEVTVKHVVHGHEVRVRVLETAYLQDVKEAVTTLLGRKDTKSCWKFLDAAKPEGPTLKQSESLGRRRRLLLAGEELLPHGWLPCPHKASRRTLYVVRHAERADHVDKGWVDKRFPLDPPLSTLGEKQALELASYVGIEEGKIPISVFVSPYLRTVQTAIPLAVRLQARIKLEWGLEEFHGMHAKITEPVRTRSLCELKAMFKNCIDDGYVSRRQCHSKSEGASLRERTTEVSARMADVTHQILGCTYGDIVLVTHQKPVNALLQSLAPLPAGCLYPEAPYGAVTTLDAWREGQPDGPWRCAVVCLSDTSHMSQLISEGNLSRH